MSDEYWREMLDRDDEFTLSPDDQFDLLSVYFKQKDQITRLEYDKAIMGSALSLIAAPVRPDGTYNRSREACEQLATEALEKVMSPRELV